MKIVETKVYTFDELSDEAKEKAVDNYLYQGINDYWYESIYYDAEMIGIKMQYFDNRFNIQDFEFINDAFECCNLIMKNHGEICDTYKLAKAFFDDRDKLVEKYGEYDANQDAYIVTDEDKMIDFDDELEDLEREFLSDLKSEYESLLSKDYDYHTSFEAVSEMMIANEYEFTENGEIV